MATMKLRLDPHGAFKAEKHITTEEPIVIILVPEGMKSGRSAIVIRLDLDDGTAVMARTSTKLWFEVTDHIREHEEERRVH
jgi:hypothetical protein